MASARTFAHNETLAGGVVCGQPDGEFCSEGEDDQPQLWSQGSNHSAPRMEKLPPAKSGGRQGELEWKWWGLKNGRIERRVKNNALIGTSPYPLNTHSPAPYLKEIHDGFRFFSFVADFGSFSEPKRSED